jgi:hypothetical protein
MRKCETETSPCARQSLPYGGCSLIVRIQAKVTILVLEYNLLEYAVYLIELGSPDIIVRPHCSNDAFPKLERKRFDWHGREGGGIARRCG